MVRRLNADDISNVIAFKRQLLSKTGLLEFVQALQLENLEQYLALLTTDGPLVPSDEPAADDEAGTGELSRRTEHEVPQ